MAKDVDPLDKPVSAQDKKPTKKITKKTGKKVAQKVTKKAGKKATKKTARGAKTIAKKGEADPFAEAMASLEDEGTSKDTATSSELQPAETDSINATSLTDSKGNIDVKFLMDIKLTITFEVGRAKMFISDLLSLGQGSVIELHRLVGEDLEIFVNGQMLATGEVVVVNERFGARITKILNPEERIQRLGPAD